MNVLITGGAGFIGQHVTKKVIESGHTAIVYDIFEDQAHRGIMIDHVLGNRVIVGDVRDRYRLASIIRDCDIHCIIHLAAQVGAGQSMYAIRKYTSHNVDGMGVLLDILADMKHNVHRVVLASSRAVYGEGPYQCMNCLEVTYPWPRTPEQLAGKVWDLHCGDCGRKLTILKMDEEDPTNHPTSIYGQNKLAQEQLLRVAANAYGLQWNILRLFNVYGPGQSVNNPYTGIVSIMMNWALSNKPMIVYEDGMMLKDFIYVEDVAEAFLKAMSAPVSGIFNIGSGIPRTMLDLTDLIGAMTSGSRIINEQYRVGDARSGYASTIKAKQFLEYEATTRLEDGLKSLYKWAVSQPIQEVLEDGKLVERGLSR